MMGLLDILLARAQQGHRTIGYPEDPPVLPDLFQGRPVVRPELCQAGCAKCADVCPTGALTVPAHIKNPELLLFATSDDAESGGDTLTLDVGRCLFCGECEKVCADKAIEFTKEYRLAVSSREALKLSGEAYEMAKALDEKALKVFGRSLKLRQVSAGGCNACESDINVLNTVVFDLGRFGIQFTAAPRHADGLLITGPVTKNMELALRKTWDAVPEPKIVIAVGACAINGGLYAGHAETRSGIPPWLKVDLYIPGCPPHPITILDGLLRLLDKVAK